MFHIYVACENRNIKIKLKQAALLSTLIGLQQELSERGKGMEKQGADSDANMEAYNCDVNTNKSIAVYPGNRSSKKCFS
jgi:hypothetical protein